MQHKDQHIRAATPTVEIRQSVSVGIFDDKVRRMGTLTVQFGQLKVAIDSLPPQDGPFIAQAIGVAIELAFDAMPEAFNQP